MKVIKLKSALRQELQSHRNEVAALIGSFIKKNREFVTLTARLEKLSKRIAALEETADLDNRALIQELAEKRVEQGLAEKKLKTIGSFDSLQGTPEGESLGSLLYQSGGLIERALSATETAFIKKIAKPLRIYCLSDEFAIWLARQTQAAAQLAGVVHRKYNHGGANIGMATQVVQLIDQILGGELTFTFDADLKNSKLSA